MSRHKGLNDVRVRQVHSDIVHHIHQHHWMLLAIKWLLADFLCELFHNPWENHSLRLLVIQDIRIILGKTDQVTEHWNVGAWEYRYALLLVKSDLLYRSYVRHRLVCYEKTHHVADCLCN